MTEAIQLDSAQMSIAKSFYSTVESMESEPMSAETNLSAETNEMNPPTDSVPNLEQTVTAQSGDPVEAESQNFTLDPDVETFDLSPDAVATVGEASTQANAPSDAQSPALEATIAELNQSIDSLKAQLEDRSAQYMRLAADFENFRKRTQKEKEEQEQQVKCSTVKEMLPVVDNFERARTQLKPQTESEMVIHKSYQGVYRQLVDAMKKLGVSAMSAEGQEFDPNLHEAVMREATDAYPEGAIMEELMRGYVLGDRVLRHAMVKVAAAPETDNASESDSVSG